MPSQGKYQIRYQTTTGLEKLVIDYTGLNLLQIQEMQIDDFLFIARESFINEMNATEDGREYLENCWRLAQTKPDREAIRSHFKKIER